MPRIRKDKAARSYAEPFWKIGLYRRLSREDDNEDESESVINQEKICLLYTAPPEQTEAKRRLSAVRMRRPLPCG